MTRRKAISKLQGMTLLELLILLSAVCVIIFIALPTLRPNDDELMMDFAKEQLLYLYGQEQAYFALHGSFAPLKDIAADKQLGPAFDQRFAGDQAMVNGVSFIGPATVGPVFELSARLPDGTVYRMNPAGQITTGR